MGTQWRVGFNGATGLDYSVIRDVFQLMSVPDSEHEETFRSIRIMESETLAYFREQRDRR